MLATVSLGRPSDSDNDAVYALVSTSATAFVAEKRQRLDLPEVRALLWPVDRRVLRVQQGRKDELDSQPRRRAVPSLAAAAGAGHTMSDETKTGLANFALEAVKNLGFPIVICGALMWLGNHIIAEDRTNASADKQFIRDTLTDLVGTTNKLISDNTSSNREVAAALRGLQDEQRIRNRDQ